MTEIYVYAGFRFIVHRDEGKFIELEAAPGQHPAALKSKHRRNAEEMFRDLENHRRRLSEIDAALARPVEEGKDWDRRRANLERERIRIMNAIVAATQ